MAGKFQVGMGSSAAVRDKGSTAVLAKNDIDSGYNLKYVPLEKFRPNKLNSDFSQEEIEEIANSIRTLGLHHALNSIYEPDTDTYRITSGERRYRGLDYMGEEERKKLFPLGIPTKLVKGIGDEVDEEIYIISANMDARQYTPEQRVKHIRRLLELYQLKQERGELKSAAKALMEQYKISERQARKYIAANKMIPELQEVLDKGGITLDDSEKFAALSEESQRQILGLINSNGLVEKEELETLKKFESENKALAAEAEKTKKDLEEKDNMISYLEKQIKEITEQQKKQAAKAEPVKANKQEQSQNESSELEEEVKRLQDLLSKESADKKRAESNLANLQLQIKENADRNINLSKEDLRRAADIAKVENIHASMFDQLKQLEKLESMIKKDEDLKIKLRVIAERLLQVIK